MFDELEVLRIFNVEDLGHDQVQDVEDGREVQVEVEALHHSQLELNHLAALDLAVGQLTQVLDVGLYLETEFNGHVD